MPDDWQDNLLQGPPGRPQHPDFMKLSGIVLKHDGPTSDPVTKAQFSFEDTVNAVIDLDTLTYMARGRAQIFMAQVGLNPGNLRLLAAIASAWCDAFLVGVEWERNLLGAIAAAAVSDDEVEFAEKPCSDCGLRLYQDDDGDWHDEFGRPHMCNNPEGT